MSAGRGSPDSRPIMTMDDIRIAVALYGDVAPAVYEAGVAHELHPAVSRKGVYREALEPGQG